MYQHDLFRFIFVKTNVIGATGIYREWGECIERRELVLLKYLHHSPIRFIRVTFSYFDV
jgi:hypothetical protein